MIRDTMETTDLPRCLERRDDGAIVLRGHRIKLYQFLEKYSQASTLEELRQTFPTISDVLLREVIAYCRDHDEECNTYFAQQKRHLEQLSRQIPNAPSLDELRGRK